MMPLYYLDTNVLSDLLHPRPNPTVIQHLNRVFGKSILCLCAPVDYEIRRGYLKTGAISKISLYEQSLATQLAYTPIVREDWQLAADFWARANAIGRQLSDMDLLIAAITYRTNGIIVTADNDFDVLPLQRVNWRVG